MQNTPSTLSKRERQIMDVIYQLGSATATVIQENLEDPPGNATVRKLLRILEEKGVVYHTKSGNQFEYHPTVSVQDARDTALDHMVNTFFRGSTASAVLTLMKKSDIDIGEKEKKLIEELIANSRKAGR